MALERFIPKSPDINIRNGQDFEVAKFGHLNTIVEYINNNTVQPAGLNGYVQFNDNNALGGDAGLFWDNVNKRLGVGTVTPDTTLSVNGITGINNSLYLGNTNSFLSTNRFQILNSANTAVTVNVDAGGSISTNGRFQVYNAARTAIAQAMYYDGATMIFRPMNDGVESTAFRNNTQTLNILNFNGVNGNVDLNLGSASLGSKLGIRGSGSTSATTALLVQNSAGTQLFRVYDDGTTDVGVTLHFYPSGLIYTNYGSLQLQGASRIQINNSEVLANANDFSWANSNFLPSNGTRNNFQFIGNTSSFTNSGAGGTSIGNVLKFNINLATVVGDVTLNHINIDNTINTTAGTTLQRGFYYNPTLTSTVGFTHRAIETTTGDVLLATTSGSVGIGTSAPTSKLYLDGGIFTKKYYTDTTNQTINFGSAYELFGTPHASSGYSFFINPTGFSSGWDVNIGNATTYFNFNYSTGFSAFKVNATALILGESELSFYKSSPDTGWSYNSAGGWNFVIRGSADEKLRITSGGNVLINTTTDLGGKLSIKGSGSTSATTSLLVKNSSSTTTLSVNDAGIVTTGGDIFAGTIQIGKGSPTGIYNVAIGQYVLAGLVGSSTASYTIAIGQTAGGNIASGTYNVIIGAEAVASSTAVNNSVIIGSEVLARTTSAISNTLAIGTGSNVVYYPTIYATNINTDSPNVRIGNNSAATAAVPTAPKASAIFELSSTTQGFLPPQMTNAQRGLITTPSIGLIVYCTDAVEGIYVYKSTGWTFVA